MEITLTEDEVRTINHALGIKYIRILKAMRRAQKAKRPNLASYAMEAADCSMLARKLGAKWAEKIGKEGV